MDPVSKMVTLSRGLYVRVARRVGCDASYIRRVARGERRSAVIEAALSREFRRVVAKMGREVAVLAKRHGVRG